MRKDEGETLIIVFILGFLALLFLLSGALELCNIITKRTC